MTDTSIPLTLDGLQRRLDELPPGQALALAISDYRRLFGLNDAAQAQAGHFARGHDCIIDARPNLIVFRKMAPGRAGAAG